MEFPFLTLLVSGGHCQLLLARGVGDYAVLGGTLDDAAGEAFDKTARLLGLDVAAGGGPALEALAAQGDADAVPFPVPMARRRDCDFSFAGLKTSVRTAVGRLAGAGGVLTDTARADVAASFQRVAVRHLQQRTATAVAAMVADAEAAAAAATAAAAPAAAGAGGVADGGGAAAAAPSPPPVTTLVVAGGVAANASVRSALAGVVAATPGWSMVVPPPALCTDNGVMVAWAAAERLLGGVANEREGWAVRARWPLGGRGG